MCFWGERKLTSSGANKHQLQDLWWMCFWGERKLTSNGAYKHQLQDLL
jgi:hypothetical protein